MFNIIVNPAGGGGKTLKLLNKIKPYLDFKNVSYVVYESSLDFGITDICRKITLGDEVVKIILIGGDGSLNEAVNGIRDFSLVKLGWIPCGSGNDLGRDIPLKKNPLRIIDDILDEAKERKADVAYVEAVNPEFNDGTSFNGNYRRYFNVSCGIGFDAETCVLVEQSKMKKVLNKVGLGKLIYLMEALKLFVENKKYPMEISVDGKTEKYDKLFFIACMNHQYEGGGFRFCPDADYNDSLIDVCIAGDLKTAEMFVVMPSCLNGKHTGNKKIHMRRGKKITIKSETALYVHTDGEAGFKAKEISIRTSSEKITYLF